MTPKEKAENLIKKFEPYVYPFSGSSMLTNTESERVILDNAKICANITVDEILATVPQEENEIFGVSKGMEYWVEVKKEVENIK